MTRRVLPEASLMCADALRLGEQIAQIERAGVPALHIDIMDARFVPNLALNFELGRAVKAVTKLPVIAHLMVCDPLRFVPDLAGAADFASIHCEATTAPLRVISALRARGIRPGIALNPATPAAMVRNVLGAVDFALCMTVEPGYAGQAFLPAALANVRELAAMREAEALDFDIEVDGNISAANARRCMDAGANMLVLGTAGLFRPGHALEAAYAEFCREAGVAGDA